MKSISTNSQRGAGMVEFLVVTPVTILLLFAIYDINRRVSEVQTTSIAVRHSLVVPANTSAGRALAEERAKAAFNDLEPLLTIGERTAINTNTDLKVDLTYNVSGNSLRQPSAVKGSDNNDHSSSYNEAAERAGDDAVDATEALADWYHSSTSLATVGAILPDKVRENRLSVHTQGQHNEVVKLFDDLYAAMIPLDPLASNIDLDFHASRRLFVRTHDGYHSNKYVKSSLFATTLGLWGNQVWAGSDGFEQNAQQLQMRCMGRFTSDNRCNSPNNLFITVPSLPNGSGLSSSIPGIASEAFPKKIEDFSDKWMKLLLIEESWGDATWAVQIAKTAVETVASTMETFFTETTIQVATATLPMPGVSSVVLQRMNLGLTWHYQSNADQIGNELRSIY